MSCKTWVVRIPNHYFSNARIPPNVRICGRYAEVTLMVLELDQYRAQEEEGFPPLRLAA